MKLIIGADEAGRGAWAGPLVAAAVCLKTGQKFNHKLLRDSKKLSPQQREEVFAYLQEVVEIGIGIVSSEEIDRVGLQRANVMAIERAIKKLRIKNEELRVLELRVDYIGAFKKYTTLKENYSLHKFGESKFPEIAAASIIAKVTRDRMMVESAKEFSHYGFELHKGYGTRLHQKQLKKYGVTEIHRKTFGPIRELKTKKSKVKTET
jgi:ribonuclease HII